MASSRYTWDKCRAGSPKYSPVSYTHLVLLVAGAYFMYDRLANGLGMAGAKPENQM